jgi:hypothetical protein
MMRKGGAGGRASVEALREEGKERDEASNGTREVLLPYSGRAKSGPRSKTGLGKADGRITDRVPYGCLGPVRPCKLRLRQLGFVSCLVRVS